MLGLLSEAERTRISSQGRVQTKTEKEATYQVVTDGVTV